MYQDEGTFRVLARQALDKALTGSQCIGLHTRAFPKAQYTFLTPCAYQLGMRAGKQLPVHLGRL